MALVAKIPETAADMRFISGYDGWRGVYMNELAAIWEGRASVDTAVRKAVDPGNAVLIRHSYRK